MQKSVRRDRFKHWTLEGIVHARQVPCVRALLVPHAGFQYTGQVLDAAYSAIHGYSVQRVFVIGPCHAGGVVPPEAYAVDVHHSHYESTPVGIVPELASTLVSRASWENEHSIEMQVAVLRQILAPGWSVVPIMVGRDAAGSLSRVLVRLLLPNDLVVFTADLTHQDAGDRGTRDDLSIVTDICRHAVSAESYHLADAPGVLGTLAAMSLDLKWVIEPRRYSRPAHVGYFGAVLLSPPITSFERKHHPSGCFVTLFGTKGQVIGCRGLTDGNISVRECQKRSRSAALLDERFEQNTIKTVHHSVTSVLSRRVEVPIADVPSRIVAGHHGVIVTLVNQSSALFLPSVWQTYPQVDSFLSALAAKAGGSMSDIAHVQIFTAVELPNV